MRYTDKPVVVGCAYIKPVPTIIRTSKGDADFTRLTMTFSISSIAAPPAINSAHYTSKVQKSTYKSELVNFEIMIQL